MKFSSAFTEYLDCSDSLEVFQYFQDNLTDSITLWDYFVNWQKVLRNFREIEVQLNILNFLIGKDKIKEEFYNLLKKYPEVANVIPILLACRSRDFSILTDYSNHNLQYKHFNFHHRGQLSEQEVHDVLEFTEQSGILALIQDKIIRSLPDYVLGVEVGLDSNGRKNRGGTTMETIVKNSLQNIVDKQNFLIMSQATSPKIWKEWRINVEVDKSSRRFDFAVKNDDVLYLIETNFYGSTGSKLKATAGDYKSLFDFLSSQVHKFIWITDGLGWKRTLRPLEETFNYIDYTLNLKMVATGLLSEIISQKL